MRKLVLLLSVFLMSCGTENKQSNTLRSDISQISQAAQGTVGIALMNLENGDTLTCNGSLHLPMQSVFKFPIAIAVLNKVDSGMLSLDQQIHISKEQMTPKIWSPLRDKFPNGNIDVSIRELISYMVSQSDNVACDALIELAGGPAQIESYLHSLGIKDIAITCNEQVMQSAWNIQYNNWCTPQQMMYILADFYKGKYLSPASTAYLIKVMTETSTSMKRIMGLLPEGTVAARKSGTGGTNKDGLTAATNDVGIITLPNGKHLVIAAFVSDSKANDSVRDLVIARITKAAYDNACNNKPLQ
jgi:beta-lactamase class A